VDDLPLLLQVPRLKSAVWSYNTMAIHQAMLVVHLDVSDCWDSGDRCLVKAATHTSELVGN